MFHTALYHKATSTPFDFCLKIIFLKMGWGLSKMARRDDVICVAFWTRLAPQLQETAGIQMCSSSSSPPLIPPGLPGPYRKQRKPTRFSHPSTREPCSTTPSAPSAPWKPGPDQYVSSCVAPCMWSFFRGSF